MPRPHCLLFILSLGSATAAQGRGDYLNFETPLVKPLAVARVGLEEYLLACNTPDSSLNVYRIAAGNQPLLRIPVGLGPVSVSVRSINASTVRAYTANMEGDSVTAVRLQAAGGTLTFTVERTENVGNEPMYAFTNPAGTELIVTNQSSFSFARRDPVTLQPLGLGLDRIELTDTQFTGATPTKAIKQPRAGVFVGNTLAILGNRGGLAPANNAFGGANYTFGLWAVDLSTNTPHHVDVLGTINFNLALAANNDLFVVGTEAQNKATANNGGGLGGEVVALGMALQDGFVTSHLYKITNLTTTPSVTSRNLNRDAAGGVFPPGQTLTHPNDVALYEPPGTPLAARLAFIAALNVDRVGRVGSTHLNTPSQWTIDWIPIAAVRVPGGMAGPRGLVPHYAVPGVAGDRDAVYVMNQVDNSITELDPLLTGSAAVRTAFALAIDPTPAYIRAGRRFLYDATLSQSHNAACESCHPEGKTDTMVWDLGKPANSPRPPVNPFFLDGIAGLSDLDFIKFNNVLTEGFWPPKGPMFTQSLQGLVNWETNPEFQGFASNAPYHWRGDKNDFVDFKAAFTDLLGASTAQAPTDADMVVFREFINSIHYPPNPEQPAARVYSGTLGTPNDLASGSAAQKGLKLFHIAPLLAPTIPPPPQAGDPLAGRSCVHCHALPESSNNRFTEFTEVNPIETAATRGLLQKEKRIEHTSSIIPPVPLIRTANFGLAHAGPTDSINAFVSAFSNVANGADLDAVTAFMREFDTGTAPIVGRALTATTSNKNTTATRQALALLEGQVLAANGGLTVYLRNAGTQRGYWFDATTGAPGYREEPYNAANPLLTTTQLLNLVAGASDVAIFQGVPLGSDRRVASLNGVVASLPTPSITQIQLQSMVPNTAYAPVPQLTKNWPKGTGPDDFNWTGKQNDTAQTPVAEPGFAKTIRLFQQGIGGVLRHDAPRRFRVSGAGIQPGSKLVLEMNLDTSSPPPNTNNLVPILLPIYPTQNTAGGNVIWETAVETEPLVYYLLLAGGLAAPFVQFTVLNPELVPEPPPPGTYQPAAWNKLRVSIEAPNGTRFSPPPGLEWQRLTIQ